MTGRAHLLLTRTAHTLRSRLGLHRSPSGCRNLARDCALDNDGRAREGRHPLLLIYGRGGAIRKTARALPPCANGESAGARKWLSHRRKSVRQAAARLAAPLTVRIKAVAHPRDAR